MKAIRVHEFGPPEAMRLEDVTDLKPGHEQVVVRVLLFPLDLHPLLRVS